MTTTAPARRPVVGLLLALAGLLAGLGILFVYFAPSLEGAWVGIIVDSALTLAFLFLVFGRSAPLVLRVAFAVATIGWAIITIGGLVSLGLILIVGIWFALAGTLVSGILVMSRLLFSNAANVFFLLAAIVIVIVLLNQLIGPFLSSTIGLVVSVLYAVLLLLAGILIAIRK
jgi:hypothetical protein